MSFRGLFWCAPSAGMRSSTSAACSDAAAKSDLPASSRELAIESDTARDASETPPRTADSTAYTASPAATSRPGTGTARNTLKPRLCSSGASLAIVVFERAGCERVDGI